MSNHGRINNTNTGRAGSPLIDADKNEVLNYLVFGDMLNSACLPRLETPICFGEESLLDDRITYQEVFFNADQAHVLLALMLILCVRLYSHLYLITVITVLGFNQSLSRKHFKPHDLLLEFENDCSFSPLNEILILSV